MTAPVLTKVDFVRTYLLILAQQKFPPTVNKTNEYAASSLTSSFRDGDEASIYTKSLEKLDNFIGYVS